MNLYVEALQIGIRGSPENRLRDNPGCRNTADAPYSGCIARLRCNHLIPKRVLGGEALHLTRRPLHGRVAERRVQIQSMRSRNCFEQQRSLPDARLRERAVAVKA